MNKGGKKQKEEKQILLIRYEDGSLDACFGTEKDAKRKAKARKIKYIII